MAEARGKRELRLDDGQVAIWANKDGVFLASTDPDASFIVPLHNTPERVARAALARYNRKTN
jgi:hypothetical protein